MDLNRIFLKGACPTSIGGQAIMEGIMMRSGDQYSVGVRKPDGEIEVKVEPYNSWAKDKQLWKF